MHSHVDLSDNDFMNDDADSDSDFGTNQNDDSSQNNEEINADGDCSRSTSFDSD